MKGRTAWFVWNSIVLLSKDVSLLEAYVSSSKELFCGGDKWTGHHGLADKKLITKTQTREMSYHNAF